MTEPMHLYLYFRCGHLVRVKTAWAAKRWLADARHALCPDCTDKKDVKPEQATAGSSRQPAEPLTRRL